jgi:alcohol dehydrogenase (cytochrome c)
MALSTSPRLITLWAVDARTGHPISRYTYPNKGGTIGQRGVAIYHDSLYYLPGCPPGLSRCQKWQAALEVEVADSAKGYWSTAAPVIVGDHVIVGIGGDSDNIQGFLKSMDANTGALQWKWDSTPPNGTPNATTGGMTWIPGTYDPELNVLYLGTGNRTPVLNGAVRPGDDLYTCSIVALNPDTGKLV